jgi:hypothetical protein
MINLETLAREYANPIEDSSSRHHAFIAFLAGAACRQAEIDELVAALNFYAAKENWTIQEDYDGYINEGFIVSEDIECPPKNPNTWSGYGYGGRRAREALKKHGSEKDE